MFMSKPSTSTQAREELLERCKILQAQETYRASKKPSRISKASLRARNCYQDGSSYVAFGDCDAKSWEIYQLLHYRLEGRLLAVMSPTKSKVEFQARRSLPTSTSKCHATEVCLLNDKIFALKRTILRRRVEKWLPAIFCAFGPLSAGDITHILQDKHGYLANTIVTEVYQLVLDVLEGRQGKRRKRFLPSTGRFKKHADGRWGLYKQEHSTREQPHACRIELDQHWLESSKKVHHQQSRSSSAIEHSASSTPCNIERDSLYNTTANSKRSRLISLLNTSLAPTPPNVTKGKRKRSPGESASGPTLPAGKRIALTNKLVESESHRSASLQADLERERPPDIQHSEDVTESYTAKPKFDLSWTRTRAIHAQHSLVDMFRKFSLDNETLAYRRSRCSPRTLELSGLTKQRRSAAVGLDPPSCRKHQVVPLAGKSRVRDDLADSSPLVPSRRVLTLEALRRISCSGGIMSLAGGKVVLFYGKRGPQVAFANGSTVAAYLPEEIDSVATLRFLDLNERVAGTLWQQSVRWHLGSLESPSKSIFDAIPSPLILARNYVAHYRDVPWSDIDALENLVGLSGDLLDSIRDSGGKAIQDQLKGRTVGCIIKRMEARYRLLQKLSLLVEEASEVDQQWDTEMRSARNSNQSMVPACLMASHNSMGWAPSMKLPRPNDNLRSISLRRVFEPSDFGIMQTREKRKVLSYHGCCYIRNTAFENVVPGNERFIAIPGTLNSEETLKHYFPFNGAVAAQLLHYLAELEDHKEPRYQRNIVAIAKDYVNGCTNAVAESDDWAVAMHNMGLTTKFQNQLMSNDYRDMRLRRGLKACVNDYIVTQFDGLLSIQAELRKRNMVQNVSSLHV